MDEEEDSKIFPQKLMGILCDPDPMIQEAICWLPHGKAFIIRNRGQFEQNIMPRFFNRKAKYSSFTRKLNRWNFSRVSSGPELGAYYHEFFRRDRPHLAAQMFCKNPRTMLALAESRVKGDSNQMDGRSIPAEIQTPDLMRSAAFPGLSLPVPTLPSAIATDLDKLSDSSRTYGHHQSLMSLAAPQLPSAQMLERQILLLQQQEEANRLLLERALLLRQQRQAGIVGYANRQAEEQKLQDEQSLRLRLLMGIPARRGERRTKPSSNRASAA